MKLTPKQQHEMYMANASPNTRRPNATYIPPARIGLTLGPWGFALGLWGFTLGPQAFQIPTCWYRQRESLAFGALPNASTKREGVSVAVEFRLNTSVMLVQIALKLAVIASSCWQFPYLAGLNMCGQC